MLCFKRLAFKEALRFYWNLSLSNLPKATNIFIELGWTATIQLLLCHSLVRLVILFNITKISYQQQSDILVRTFATFATQ